MRGGRRSGWGTRQSGGWGGCPRGGGGGGGGGRGGWRGAVRASVGVARPATEVRRVPVSSGERRRRLIRTFFLMLETPFLLATSSMRVSLRDLTPSSQVAQPSMARSHQAAAASGALAA